MFIWLFYKFQALREYSKWMLITSTAKKNAKIATFLLKRQSNNTNHYTMSGATRQNASLLCRTHSIVALWWSTCTLLFIIITAVLHLSVVELWPTYILFFTSFFGYFFSLYPIPSDFSLIHLYFSFTFPSVLYLKSTSFTVVLIMS